MKVPWTARGPEAEGAAAPLTVDFSAGLHQGSPDASWIAPASAEEAAEAIRRARAEGRVVRFRGHGHSMNGSSLPRAGDVVLTSQALRGYCFEAPRAVTVGAGAQLWDVHTLLRERGHTLLVANDGAAPAPSVGGFVSAGGIGENTHVFGGFWETVEELVVVTGAGEIVRLRSDDALFPWMFGAMGQLGFVVEATLRTLPVEPHGPGLPVGERGQVPHVPARWSRYAWFTLFVPFPEAEAAMEHLAEVGARHAQAWRPLAAYVYPIRFRRFNPPLIYPARRGFVAVGIWGTPSDPAAGFDFGAVRALAGDVTALTRSHPGWRRYIQTEMTFGDVDYAAHFGEEVHEAFRAMKRRFDPGDLLGRGQVFR